MTTWVVNDLGFLPGGTFSIAQAASSDGSVIVGVADTGADPGNGHAFRWTLADGLVDLGVLAGGANSIAYGVSADGTVVVGGSDGGASGSGNTEAFRWTSGTGMVGLGFLSSGTGSTAFGISPDGGTIVGTSSIIPGSVLTLPTFPFSWTSGGGMVGFGAFGSNPDGIGQGASTSGATIVGGGNDPSDVPWKFVSSTLSAVPMPGGETAGAAEAVSPDGTAIAGFSNTTPGSNSHAYLWTSGGGAILLGFLGTGDTSAAYGISGDGTIVVGFSNNGVSIFNQAFVWDAGDGMVALPGLNIAAPGGAGQGVSSDGLTLVGSSRGNETEPALHAVYWSPSGPPPSGGPTTLAELWFAPTSGFVDLTVESNRRNFIGANGGARDLGGDGSAPFGVSPQVYLTRRGLPATFATNNGRGGSFIVSDGTLAAGDTNPPASSTAPRSFVPFPSGQGVLGDYRNGNLYTFNPATYTDNGTSRVWLRRWRALPAGGVLAVKFNWLSIKMQTGNGMLDEATPQIMLRWSDDGGNTWSNYRILPVGRRGQTAFTVKANRLGMTRRFAGSDRIYELSSTDPFKVAIMDADLEAS